MSSIRCLYWEGGYLQQSLYGLDRWTIHHRTTNTQTKAHLEPNGHVLGLSEEDGVPREHQQMGEEDPWQRVKPKLETDCPPQGALVRHKAL